MVSTTVSQQVGPGLYVWSVLLWLSSHSPETVGGNGDSELGVDVIVCFSVLSHVMASSLGDSWDGIAVNLR